MIYNVQFIVVIFVLLAVNAKAFQMQSSRMSNTGSMRMALSDYREELARTAAAIAAPGNYSLRINSTSFQIRNSLRFPSLHSLFLSSRQRYSSSG